MQSVNVNLKLMSKFYIIDTGEKMVTIAENLEKLLRKNGHHYVSYLTDLEYYIAIEEVTDGDKCLVVVHAPLL